MIVNRIIWMTKTFRIYLKRHASCHTLCRPLKITEMRARVREDAVRYLTSVIQRRYRPLHRSTMASELFWRSAGPIDYAKTTRRVGPWDVGVQSSWRRSFISTQRFHTEWNTWCSDLLLTWFRMYSWCVFSRLVGSKPVPANIFSLQMSTLTTRTHVFNVGPVDIFACILYNYYYFTSNAFIRFTETTYNRCSGNSLFPSFVKM